MQRRVRAPAQEENIPPTDYLHKRVLTGDILAFGKNHQVSIDRLMCGNLKAATHGASTKS
jgi:hypothetical protein